MDQIGTIEQTQKPRIEISTTVLNVWGIKGPLDQGSAFTVSVGAKNLKGFSLAGSTVKILDGNREVVGSCPLIDPQDRRRAPFQGAVDLTAPMEPGFHKWFALLKNEAGVLLAEKPVPFSVTPAASRKVTIKIIDDVTEKPLDDCTLFFYNDDLEKTAPISTDTNERGVATIEIAPDAPCSVRFVRENYVEGFHDIPAGSDAYEGTVGVRSKFRIKIARPLG